MATISPHCRGYVPLPALRYDASRIFYVTTMRRIHHAVRNADPDTRMQCDRPSTLLSTTITSSTVI
jgi:hypothetical protein